MDCHSLIWVAGVSVANDVGDCFFQAEVNSELRVCGDGVFLCERFYPGPHSIQLSELTFKNQSVVGRDCALLMHEQSLQCYFSAASAAVRS